MKNLPSNLASRTASLATFLSVLLCSSAAYATHKSWFKMDGATACMPEDGSKYSNFYFYDVAANKSSSSQSLVCPVALGGRFAGTGAVTITAHDKVPALFADLYYNDGSSSGAVICSMVALTTTRSMLWSASRYSCSTKGGCSSLSASFQGVGVLSFADPGGANRRVGVSGAATTAGIRSLAYKCTLPGIGSSASGVTGTVTTTCQQDPALGRLCDSPGATYP